MGIGSLSGKALLKMKNEKQGKSQTLRLAFQAQLLTFDFAFFTMQEECLVHAPLTRARWIFKGIRITVDVTDHRVGDQVQRCTPTVSDYRVRQMRDRGLRAMHMVCEQADNKADVVPCDRLPVDKSHRGKGLP
jgi:hypothetical protein